MDNRERDKQLEDAVGNLLDAKNLRYMRVDNYRCFKCGQVQNSKAKGHPDFEVYYPHFYIECKTGTGKLTKDQKEIKYLIEKNAHYIIARDNIDELIKFLDVLLPHVTISKRVDVMAPSNIRRKRSLINRKVIG